jgi:hypothetical protein
MTPHILIAGGGVAALEAAVALHELSPDRLRHAHGSVLVVPDT